MAAGAELAYNMIRGDDKRIHGGHDVGTYLEIDTRQQCFGSSDFLWGRKVWEGARWFAGLLMY